MEDTAKLIREYLPQGRIMQVATVSGDQPWVCNVHYVADENQNIYWLSLPTRRHSQELQAHNKAAVAIAVKTEKPVIGVQAEGTVAVVEDKDEIARVMKQYVERFQIGGDFYDNFIAGKHAHHMYKFTPKLIVLFDEVDFPRETSRREWRVTG